MRRYTHLPLASIAIALILLSSPSAAQTLIRLHLVADSTIAPVAKATVSLAGTRVSAVADDSGWASLLSPFVGYHSLVLSHPGFKTVELGSIDMEGPDTVTVEVALPAGDSSERIQSYAYFRGRTRTDEVIRLTPGLVKDDQNGGISVRGTRGTSNSIVLNATEVSNPQTSRSTTLNNSLSRLAVSEVQVSTAPGDASKGGYTGGAIRGKTQTDVSSKYRTQPLASCGTPQAPFNTENYLPINENGFHRSMSDPLSTFSIDVDVASYGNMRRFLMQAQVPPADAVRVEELINYFTYDYPEPTNGRPFSVSTDVATCPWNLKHEIVSIGLQAKHVASANLPPANLVFLIDVSGSMATQEKLPLLKKAFALLVKELRAQDHVAIVTYAGAAGVALDCTPCSEKEKILGIIEQLGAGGSTAGAQGILTAYRLAKEHFDPKANNRVILATDGDFNVGVSSDGELVRMMEEKRKDGIYLTILGFGTENYKDSKMEQIADKGNGNYAYIDNLLEAQKVLVQQFGGTMFTVANDVKIQVEFNPAKVQAYRLLGYEDRLLENKDFNDDRKDAGEIGAGHSVTALYEIVPAGIADEALGSIDSLKYQTVSLKTTARTSDLMTVKLRYKDPRDSVSKLIEHTIPANDVKPFESASENLRFASSVAEFGMLLHNSQWKGSASLEHVTATANASRSSDPNGYRAEFARLVTLYSLIDLHAAR